MGNSKAQVEAIRGLIRDLVTDIKGRKYFELGAKPTDLEKIVASTWQIHKLVGELNPEYSQSHTAMKEQNVYYDVLKYVRECSGFLEAVRSRSGGSEENTTEFLRKLDTLEQAVSALLELERGAEIASPISSSPTESIHDHQNVQKSFADVWQEELAGIQDNDEYLQLLLEQLRRPTGIIPFVGAGFSVPSGFPGWGSFLLTQARKAGVESAIQARLDDGQYEEAAEDLLAARAFRAFQDAIRITFGPRKLNGKTIQGAVRYVPKLASGPVITTNFDRVLERVFEDAGCPFEERFWGPNIEMAVTGMTEHRRFLLKIHGDAEDSTLRILTKSDYERHYGRDDEPMDFSLPLPQLLRQMLSSRHLLFLGCSLNQDRTVSVLKRSSPHVPHFAIVEQPTRDFYERARFLSDHNIRPIWYPQGRFDLIEPLLVFLLQQKSKTGA